MKKISLFLVVVAVYALHQDFWNWKNSTTLVFGFLPIGLAYHAAYALLCALMMAILVKWAWPKHLEDVVEHRDEDAMRKPQTPNSKPQ